MRMTLTFGEPSSALVLSLEGHADVALPLSAHLYRGAPTIAIGHLEPNDIPSTTIFDDVYVRID